MGERTEMSILNLQSRLLSGWVLDNALSTHSKNKNPLHPREKKSIPESTYFELFQAETFCKPTVPYSGTVRRMQTRQSYQPSARSGAEEALMTALRLRRHLCLAWKLAFTGADVISVLGLLLANGYAGAERVRGASGALRESEKAQSSKIIANG
jgi:hypothetical protein